MVEILENKITLLENIKILVIFKTNPLTLLTAPLNKHSEFRPQGGKYLAHFGNVLILITRKKRFIEYSLIQHPSMPEKLQSIDHMLYI